MEFQLNCPNCKQNILAQDYFCPNCGKKLKDKPLSASIPKQIFIYLFSIFLPPLGIWPAVKYLKQKDKKSKIIGLIAIFLTVISLAAAISFTLDFMNAFNRELNQQLNGSLNLYR